MVVNALTKTCKWMLYLLAAVIILVALLAASIRLAVFYSEDYSEELASLVSSIVGSPVEIGEVDLVWNRFDANASLKDVQIRSPDGTETLLELPGIELQLNVRDVLLERRLSVRNIQLSDLSLTASYEGGGDLRMFGVQLGRTSAQPAGQPRNTSALNWLFNAERISILDSEITLIDAAEDREFKVDDINITVSNNGDRHQIRISSALPGDTGETSLASFDFTGKAENVDEWNGQFYLKASALNIEELSELWRAPEQEYAGNADVQVWGAWSGTKINKVRVIASASDFSLQQNSSDSIFETPLQASKVDVDFDWLRDDSGWQLNFSQLAGLLDDQKLLLDGLQMQMTRESGEAHYSIAGPDIDLQSLKPLHPYIDAMLPADTPFRMHALRAGSLNSWRVAGVVADDTTRLTELRANVVDLTVDPYDETPGIRDLSASVVFADGTGRVSLDNQDVSISLPSLFDGPMPVVNLDGDIRFLVNSDAASTDQSDDKTLQEDEAPRLIWKAVAEDLRVGSLEVESSSVASISGHTDGSLMVDLHTSILNASVARLKDFYPVKIIKPGLLDWLQTAIIGGDIVRGRVELKGNLKDFSPVNDRGHFYAEADLVGATVKFKPDWPAARRMDGNVSFSSSAMRGRVYKGSIREARFSDARLFVPDFLAPVIEVQSSAIGPVADLLDFVQTGPLAPSIGGVFGKSTGTGTSRFSLDLKVPLDSSLPDELFVDGEVFLENAQINSSAFGLDLDSVTGKVKFNRNGVTFDDMVVRYQGLPMSVSAVQESTSKNHFNRIRVKGPMAAASVMQSYGIPMVGQFEGVSDWTVDIDVNRPVDGGRARIEFNAISDLAGTELHFPVPLKKAPGVLQNVRIYCDFSGQENDWWIEVPGLMKSRIRISDDFKFESMAVALGGSENHVLPWRGISIQGDARRIDAAGWVRFAMHLETPEQSDGKALPLFAKVSADQMAIGDEIFDEFVYIAYQDGADQVHRAENSLLSGELRLKQNRVSDEPLVFNIDRLDKRLLVAVADDAEARLVAGEVTNLLPHPRDYPPLEFRVSELKWDNWRFSKVALRTEPGEEGMQITALTARQNFMRVSGRGYWKQSNSAGGDVADLTTLDLTASFDDFGRAMGQIANVQSYAKGTGEAALSLNWPTPAYAPDLNQLRGQLLFNLRDGRILSVQPGAGRILGLFALQSLPRRLTFDFRDITDTGLAYSGVSGNLTIANGQAHANAIALSGPVAEILVHGSTDFVNNTYDQIIDVLPRVSGTLPLLGALSAGPAAGVTALLAGGVLKGLGVNLDELGKRRFTLTGSWSDPVWTTVDLGPQNQRPR